MIIPFPRVATHRLPVCSLCKNTAGTIQLPLSHNCQLTLEFERELRVKLGPERYKRLSFVWVSLTGERYVSWDRLCDVGASAWFSSDAGMHEIVAQLMSLLG